MRIGALEGFGAIPALLRQLERGGWRGGQLPLFALETPGGEDWTLAEKAAAQEAAAGRRSGGSPAGAASRPDRHRRRPHHGRGRRKAEPACARRRHAPDLAPQPHHRRRLYLLHGARRPGRHAGCRDPGGGLPPQPRQPSPVRDPMCWRAWSSSTRRKASRSSASNASGRSADEHLSVYHSV